MLAEAIAIGSIWLSGFFCYRKFYCHRYFKNLGIPGPEPHWFWGNLDKLWTDDRHLVMSKWTEQYGEFYGYYEGPTPVLVTTSLEAVERIGIKQFSDFQGHNLIVLAPNPTDEEIDSEFHQMLWAVGEEWKRLRMAANPAFSTGKLKGYTPFLKSSQEKMLNLFQENADSRKEFDIRSVFQLLTLDVIGEIAFGFDLKAIETRGQGSQLLVDLRKLMSPRNDPTDEFLRVLPCLIPLVKPLARLALKNKIGPVGCIGSIFDIAGRMITMRKNNPDLRRNDLLQMMIDAPSLTENEIKAMSFLFLTAGYETTSSVLSYVTYCLAANKDCQDKLRHEILSYFPNTSKEIDYETVMNKMEYLDWICKETMRLYPIGNLVVNRFVVCDTELCGIPLTPRCMSVLVDMWNIHQNPNYWGPVEPEKFYPERFSPEYSSNRPELAFLAFGVGPRLCIGMRLALFEMKLTLINILLRFEFLPPVGGYPPGGLKVSSRESLMVPIEGVSVRLRNL